jgi:hypothetical protein
VEIDKYLVKDVMALTGETKMSAAIAKATELFANRKKAVALLRSLREEPMNYQYTNDEIEAWGETPLPTSPAQVPAVRAKKGKKNRGAH